MYAIRSYHGKAPHGDAPYPTGDVVKLKAFNRCKKTGLRKNIVRDSADLEACLGGDPTGAVARICDPVIGRLV